MASDAAGIKSERKAGSHPRQSPRIAGRLEHRTQKWNPLLRLIRCSVPLAGASGVRKTGSTFPSDALERHVQRAAEAAGLEAPFEQAAEFVADAALDQPGAEAEPGRLADGRPVLLDPID